MNYPNYPKSEKWLWDWKEDQSYWSGARNIISVVKSFLGEFGAVLRI